ncbi:hypothetical protein [Geodermatophilus obscurus]|uniref:baeRF2 domain-containing protein n=1 Tax=Geodermatophilus obscurus TaxID=1861 RepID=UPI001140B931|nr:hypothetical protein [Geodermatophilus obscurus]
MASVYLGTHHGVRDGADRVLTRWQEMRRGLRDEGAPESMLGTLDECTRQAPVRGETMAVFACADGRSHVEHLSRAVQDRAFLGPLPHVSPLLTARHRAVPVVVVVTDRRGADLLLVEPGAQDLACQVVGEDLLITGSTPDALHRRLERAEERWTTNARAISESVTWLVDCSRARLVVAGGEAGTLQLLRGRLEPRIRAVLVTVGTSSDLRSLAARARIMAADAAALEEAAAVEEVSAGLADGRACVGAAPTLRAVVHGQAEEVLIAPNEADRHWVRRLSPDVADAPDRRRHAGSPTGRHAPLSDVLVRAASSTSTVVRTIRDGRRLDGGAGALLRGPADAPPLPPGGPAPP